MSIYRMIWWITAVILAASGGIAAAVTVQTDVLVSAVIAAVLIGGVHPGCDRSHVVLPHHREISLRLRYETALRGRQEWSLSSD